MNAAHASFLNFHSVYRWSNIS